MQPESPCPSFPAPPPRRETGIHPGLGAGVTDPAIRDARPLPSPPAAVPANDPADGVPRRPFAAQPRGTPSGVRVLPLASFHWARGRAVRVRGDHCLMRVTAGTMRIALPRGTADHAAGSVIFVPAGTAFAAEPRTDTAGQVLLIPPEAAARLDLPLPRRMLAGTDSGGALAGELQALARQTADPIAAATAGCRVGLISAALNRLAEGPPGTPGTASRPGGADHALLAAYLDLAARELGRGRTIADLARALGTDAASLDAACRRLRGRSALDLIYDVRLDRARALLARGAEPDAIAAPLGFTGVAHLNRAFMAATGRPAEAFRVAAEGVARG